MTRLGSFYVHVLQREQEGTLGCLVAVSSSGAVSSTGEGALGQGCLMVVREADTHQLTGVMHQLFAVIYDADRGPRPFCISCYGFIRCPACSRPTRTP